jgi:uncharacterized membrane protein YheB (UPF0754 family)
MEEQTKVVSLVQEGIRLAVVLLEFARASQNVALAKSVNKAIDDFMNKKTKPEEFKQKVNNKLNSELKKDNPKLKKIYENSKQKEVNKVYRQGKKDIGRIMKEHKIQRSWMGILSTVKPKIKKSELKLKDKLKDRKDKILRIFAKEKIFTEAERTTIKYLHQSIKEIKESNEKLVNKVTDLEKKVLKSNNKSKEKKDALDKRMDKAVQSLKNDKVKAKIVKKNITKGRGR